MASRFVKSPVVQTSAKRSYAAQGRYIFKYVPMYLWSMYLWSMYLWSIYLWAYVPMAYVPCRLRYITTDRNHSAFFLLCYFSLLRPFNILKNKTCLDMMTRQREKLISYKGEGDNTIARKYPCLKKRGIYKAKTKCTI